MLLPEGSRPRAKNKQRHAIALLLLLRKKKVSCPKALAAAPVIHPEHTRYTRLSKTHYLNYELKPAGTVRTESRSVLRCKRDASDTRLVAIQCTHTHTYHSTRAYCIKRVAREGTHTHTLSRFLSLSLSHTHTTAPAHIRRTSTCLTTCACCC